MSFFRRNRPEPAGPDWSVAPIERVHNHRLVDPPDIFALIDSYIDEAGPGADVSEFVVLQRLLATCHTQADASLRALGRDDLAAGLTTLFERPDFNGAMMFDFLTMHGAVVWAVHIQLAEMLGGPELRDVYVAAIRAGKMA